MPKTIKEIKEILNTYSKYGIPPKDMLVMITRAIEDDIDLLDIISEDAVVSYDTLKTLLFFEERIPEEEREKILSTIRRLIKESKSRVDRRLKQILG
ncbi:MAG TPA: hypothetical protein ENG34_00595 [Candidatus Aenigmarchaeota archaeon]|nr:hypothetical protein [Candidatus Aenigmarchaeota archaeon]